LAIAKRLSELMGGRIGVESKEGQGSAFWFTAVLDRQVLKDGQTTELPANLKGKRILVVDDNQTNLEMLCTCMRSWECRCSSAIHAGEALQLMHQAVSDDDAFDLVVIDQVMPDMDGQALGMAIKASPSLSETLMLLLTSSSMHGDATRMKTIGFSAYLKKPVKQSMIYGSLIAVFGAKTHGKENASGERVTGHPIEDARSKKRRILIAEDNSINQDSYGDQPFDVASALKRAMGDQIFLKALFADFVKTLPSRLAAIDAAIDDQDSGALTASAHSLKGAAANLSMAPLADVAKAIEVSARNQNLDAASIEIERLHREGERLNLYANNMEW
jgi:CheY-like chemotaxis protein/HPt (histidine-containing phosphotransfer) domain-containing protein